MPLPWKKTNKAKAISKFVVDRIQSSKHGGSGGSLVVETGFPTSIVDLFVKNRDRLKKPPSSSKKDKKKNSKTSQNPNLDLIPILDSSSSSASLSPGDVGVAVDVPPPSTPPLLVSPPDSRTPTNFRLLPPPVPAPAAAVPPLVRIGGDQVRRSGNSGGGDQIDSTMVFMAMLKMFLVVVLALATTKFVVGITMSAFLLLLMEYAGKHYCRFFKTHPSLCFDKYSLKCFMERALCFLGINNNKNTSFPDEDDDDGDFKAPLLQQQQQELLITSEHNSNREVVQIGHSQEVEVTAPPSSSHHHHPHPPRPPRRIHCVASEPDLLSAELNWGSQQVEERNEVVLAKEAAYASCDGLESSDVKKRLSRRCRIKSKIKRLMSSNLHGSKKKRINLDDSAPNKACSTSGEDDNINMVNTMSCSGMDVVEANKQCGMEGTNECSLSSSTSENGICFSNETSRADTEDDTTSMALTNEEEHAKSKMEGNSGYLIFFATVLVGLVGGKSLAIAFTLTCCLLLKSCGILKGRWGRNGDASSTSS